jgi:acetyl-CoA carboxylase biotin carboxyl carrier protein
VSLTAAEVAEIMRLVEKSGWDELTLEMDGTKLLLRRGAGSALVQARESEAAESRAPASPAPGRAGSGAESAAAADPSVHVVTAPLLGTFYRAPKPGAAPFAVVGTVVEDDTVIGIIEVMKLMNTVRAGVRGTVTEILIADGALAEYGQPLLRVRRAG